MSWRYGLTRCSKGISIREIYFDKNPDIPTGISAEPISLEWDHDDGLAEIMVTLGSILKDCARYPIIDLDSLRSFWNGTASSENS